MSLRMGCNLRYSGFVDTEHTQSDALLFCHTSVASHHPYVALAKQTTPRS